MRPGLILATAVLTLASCSVKENRMDCPCTLDLSLAGGDDAIVILSMWDSGLRHSCALSVDIGFDRHYVKIPRGNFRMSACCGLSHDLPDDGRLILCRGEEMDRLYAGNQRLEALSDSVSCNIRMHKQYALVNVKVLCFGEKELPDPVILTGNVCGMDMLSLKPVEGEFEFGMHPIFGEYCRACVPRQTDNSLKMELDGLGTVALGRYIAECGYDWTAEDLADVEVVIDLIDSVLEIKVAGWETGRSFELII